MELKKISYRGWENCLQLSNGDVELVVSVGFGPRILVCRRPGGVNFMKNFDAQMADVKSDVWQSYGGHRLWHAPEIWPRTYYPDVDPVEYNWDGSVLRLRCVAEKTTRLRKEIDIELDASGAGVSLHHRIYNENPWAVTFSPWALTVMAAGGELFVPQEPYVPHGKGKGESFDFARPIVVWQFTDMADPRFTWGTRFIRLRQDDRFESKQKFGAQVKSGQAAYVLENEVFIKHFGYDSAATYPDAGCNIESFTMPGFLELESVGPLAPVNPGECVCNDERWELHPLKSGVDVETQLHGFGL